MTTAALITKGNHSIHARISDILSHDYWQTPMFLPPFLAKTYIAWRKLAICP